MKHESKQLKIERATIADDEQQDNNSMTTKEKAKELFDKYCYAIRTEANGSGYYTNIIHAKQCALIAVDEIINIIREFADTEILGIYLLYYENVKKEIELL